MYDSLGEYNQAKDLHEKALKIRTKIFGEDHVDVATSYSCLASVYYSLKEYNKAKQLREKALIIRKKIRSELALGNKHLEAVELRIAPESTSFYPINFPNWRY